MKIEGMFAFSAMVDEGPLPEAADYDRAYLRDFRFRVFVAAADGSGLQDISGDVGTLVVARPCWSPDGTRLVYACQDAIYRIDPDGGNRVRLGAGTLPHWAPDGRHVWFFSIARNSWEIVDPDGGDARPLFGDRRLLDPDLSPDGAVFAGVVPGERGIWLVTAEGDLVQKFADSYSYAASPLWNPAGSAIAFAACDDDSGASASSLHVLAPGDGSIHRVTGDVIAEDQALYRWSPHGQWLAVARYADRVEALYTVRADGSHERYVMELNAGDPSGEVRPSLPAWSPDGSVLAVATMTGEAYEIALFDRDVNRVHTVRWDSPVFARIDDLNWRPSL